MTISTFEIAGMQEFVSKFSALSKEDDVVILHNNPAVGKLMIDFHFFGKIGNKVYDPIRFVNYFDSISSDNTPRIFPVAVFADILEKAESDQDLIEISFEESPKKDDPKVMAVLSTVGGDATNVLGTFEVTEAQPSKISPISTDFFCRSIPSLGISANEDGDTILYTSEIGGWHLLFDIKERYNFEEARLVLANYIGRYAKMPKWVAQSEEESVGILARRGMDEAEIEVVSKDIQEENEVVGSTFIPVGVDGTPGDSTRVVDGEAGETNKVKDEKTEVAATSGQAVVSGRASNTNGQKEHNGVEDAAGCSVDDKSGNSTTFQGKKVDGKISVVTQRSKEDLDTSSELVGSEDTGPLTGGPQKVHGAEVLLPKESKIAKSGYKFEDGMEVEEEPVKKKRKRRTKKQMEEARAKEKAEKEKKRGAITSGEPTNPPPWEEDDEPNGPLTPVGVSVDKPIPSVDKVSSEDSQSASVPMATGDTVDEKTGVYTELGGPIGVDIGAQRGSDIPESGSRQVGEVLVDMGAVCKPDGMVDEKATLRCAGGDGGSDIQNSQEAVVSTTMSDSLPSKKGSEVPKVPTRERRFKEKLENNVNAAVMLLEDQGYLVATDVIKLANKEGTPKEKAEAVTGVITSVYDSWINGNTAPEQLLSFAHQVMGALTQLMEQYIDNKTATTAETYTVKDLREMTLTDFAKIREG